MLNSEYFVNFVISNSRNIKNIRTFEMFKNHIFVLKITRLFHKITLCYMFRNIFIRFRFSRCICSIYSETCEVVETMRKIIL